jgi:hypothetical protein
MFSYFLNDEAIRKAFRGCNTRLPNKQKERNCIKQLRPIKEVDKRKSSLRLTERMRGINRKS